jgi:signal transduction histidine kinase
MLTEFNHSPTEGEPSDDECPADAGRRVRGARDASDDGPGIADADKPKATERFFRGDTSRATPGVGLGLSIVEAVAKLHGGALQLLDNRPGLVARMVLPVTAAPSSR